MSAVLDTLFATVLDRQANPRPGSYTASGGASTRPYTTWRRAR